jgi:hypothetical protein
MKEPINHVDLLGQPINVGDHVSFTWSHACGVRVGIITKLTKQRVKLTFNNSYVREGVRTYYSSNHITHPSNCLVLSENLLQQLTIATLQRKI